MATAVGEFAATEAAANARTTTQIAENIESDVPTIETAAYARTLARLERNRDVYGGTERIRAGGTKYVPKFKGESAANYEARSTIAAVFNGYARTVDAMVGLICEPEPSLAAEMPQTLVDMWENVDGAGKHGAVFTRDLVAAAGVDGFAGIITEYPRISKADVSKPGVSLAATVALETDGNFDASDLKKMGIRPYFILVKVDECLPIYETVNGQRTLVMLIRRVNTTQRKERFGLVSVTRYDVYELLGGDVWYERWTVDTQGGTPKKEVGTRTKMRNLKGVPWSPLALGKKLGEHEYKPTFDDVAYLTITHHRIQTGILSLEERAFVPTKWRVGAPKDRVTGTYPELVTGIDEVIEIPMPPQGVTLPNPPVGFLSPPVDVVEPGQASLERIERHIGAMGAAFLTPQKVSETATAHRMDGRAEEATISSASRDTRDCLESAFGFAGQYVNEKADRVTMGNDFLGEGIDAAVLQILVTNYQSDRPIVTIEDVRHFLKTGQLPDGFDPDDTLGILALTAQIATDKATAQRDAFALAGGNATDTTDTRDVGNGE